MKKIGEVKKASKSSLKIYLIVILALTKHFKTE